MEGVVENTVCDVNITHKPGTVSTDSDVKCGATGRIVFGFVEVEV